MRTDLLKDAARTSSRIVVKLGTGVLTDAKKQPDLAQMEQLVAQVAHQRELGRDVILVSSGAVGAGMGVLKHDKRPTELAELQACAAVGQSRLMTTYENLFSKFDLHVAQVLLTHDDLQHHERHLNARNTLVRLLKHGVVPIINENDAVSFTEIKFGDNDKLSALVACLLPADLLIILTTVDGVIINFGQADARVLDTIDSITPEVEAMAGGTTSATAIGGMTSKIQAAKVVARSGIPLVIAPGKHPDVIKRVLNGDGVGTLFVPNERRLASRKRWIAFFHRPKGVIYVDEGAKKALREQGKSLLPPGITRCEGEFITGEIVSICDLNGTEFARGISDVTADAIRQKQITRQEVIHRDNLVVL
jgi:glutamate 5-kinase